MNNLMAGIHVGKSLAEGDYLAAAPFFSDILKAVKAAVPGLVRETAAAQLSKVQAKLGVLPAASGGPVSQTAPAAVLTVEPSPFAKWFFPAALGVGGLLAYKAMKRRR